jgi:ribosomal protein S18 acetylase RimI-like enzyme
MTIRFAETRDIPGMIDLLQQVGEVHHQIRPDLFRSGAQKYDHADLEMLLKDEKRPILICDQDGFVAGYAFCILQETRDNPVLCDRKVLYIDDICVDEQKRGQGIATALYNRVVEFARELGCHSVTLNVWCGNDSAMKFYEKCGMKPQKIGMETILC